MLTWADLNSVRDAVRRVDRIRQKLAGARADAGLHGVRYDRTDGGSSQNYNSQVENSTLKIIELESYLRVKELTLIVVKLRLWVKLYDFPDSRARLIFHYRYIDLMPWDAISKQFEQRLDANACRKCCERTLKSLGLKHGSRP